jgi:hypothetical protein
MIANDPPRPTESVAQPSVEVTTDDPVKAETEGDTQFKRRLERVDQYQNEALMRPDPLAATLGSTNSGVMEIALRLERGIIKRLDAAPDAVEAAKRIEPTLNMFLRLTRQIDRNASLERQLTNQRAASTGGVPNRPR